MNPAHVANQVSQHLCTEVSLKTVECLRKGCNEIVQFPATILCTLTVWSTVCDSNWTMAGKAVQRKTPYNPTDRTRRLATETSLCYTTRQPITAMEFQLHQNGMTITSHHHRPQMSGLHRMTWNQSHVHLGSPERTVLPHPSAARTQGELPSPPPALFGGFCGCRDDAQSHRLLPTSGRQ